MKKFVNKVGVPAAVIIIILASFPFWVPIAAVTAEKYYFTPVRKIEHAWNIDIPSDFHQIYHATSDDIIVRGESYTVFEAAEANKELTSFLTGFAFKGQTADMESYVKDVIKSLSVSEEARLSFEEPYYFTQRFTDTDRLAIIWFPEKNLCCFVESYSLNWDRQDSYRQVSENDG